MNAKDVVFEEGGTRTELTSVGNALTFAWAESDVVGIYPSVGGDPVRFPMTESAGTQSANFDGGEWALKSNCTYVGYYPFSKENAYNDTPLTAIPVSYDGQSQAANASTAHLGAYDYMVATPTVPENGIANFNFDHVNSFLYLKLAVPEAASFTCLTLNTEDSLFVQDGTVNLLDGTITSTTSSKYMRLPLNYVFVPANGYLEVWMAIAPADFSEKTIIATATATKEYKVDLAGKKFESGKAYCLEGTLKEKTEDRAPVGVEAVDLGLPSGTLWANCNLGASKPQEYGKYYAWGETSAYNEEDKSNEHNYSYDNSYFKTCVEWNTYKYCSGDNSKQSLTKYNTNSSWGSVVDNITELDLADDAAYVNWGTGWRMPSLDQMNELLSNCYFEWTNNYNGTNVKGHIVYKRLGEDTTTKTYENGYTSSCPDSYNLSCTHIFLPAAGYRDGRQIVYIDFIGSYWSRSLGESQPLYAYTLDFYFDTISDPNGYFSTKANAALEARCLGFPIRPVRSAE